MLWVQARESDECLLICKRDDGVCFLAALGTVPIQFARCIPTLMLAEGATAHSAP